MVLLSEVPGGAMEALLELAAEIGRTAETAGKRNFVNMVLCGLQQNQCVVEASSMQEVQWGISRDLAEFAEEVPG